MPPRRGTRTRTRTTPAIATATTLITDAAIRLLIAQGMADALAEQEIQRNTNLNGSGSQGSGSGITRPVRPTRECTYSDFLKCQPLNFKGIEGVVVGHDAAYGMPWKTLLKIMTAKYCPRSEIKKLEIKILNLKVKCTDVVGYTQRFQELALMCGRMFPEESDEVEKPKTIQDAIEFATELMDKKLRTLSESQAENKRKFDNNNQAQQQLPKRQQNVAQAYATETGKKNDYAETLPLCNKCKFHHNDPCTAKCVNCKKIGHLTRDCWNPTATSNQRIITCYECGNQGHYKSDFSELKNRNHGNQSEGTEHV
ncbi:retrovirus-related pol polyprotein from transposon 17.6 [Tanacetum coccineum]